MKKISERIVFFGNERLATGVATETPTLRALIAAGYEVVAVISNYERGHSRNIRDLEIAQTAKEYDIPLLLPQKLSEIKGQLQKLNATVGVLVAYGKIVPESIINIFPRGIVNIHPSLLPLHRGPTPIESVILDGAAETGASIMQLVKAMDAGPVYTQTSLHLNGDETKQELANRLLEQGKEALLRCLPAIIDGTLQPQPQDDAKATYDRLITKEEGVLDWSKTAIRLEREIRAFTEWPKSRTTLAGKDTIITRAHAVPSNDPGLKPGDLTVVKDIGVLMVETIEGTLCIDRLKPAGKKEMTAREFIAGYGQNL